jgi:hypothetical protein
MPWALAHDMAWHLRKKAPSHTQSKPQKRQVTHNLNHGSAKSHTILTTVAPSHTHLNHGSLTCSHHGGALGLCSGHGILDAQQTGTQGALSPSADRAQGSSCGRGSCMNAGEFSWMGFSLCPPYNDLDRRYLLVAYEKSVQITRTLCARTCPCVCVRSGVCVYVISVLCMHVCHLSRGPWHSTHPHSFSHTHTQS